MASAALPELVAWDACVAVGGRAFARAPPPEDTTDWPAIIKISDSKAAASAAYYVSGAVGAQASIRRARTLVKRIAREGDVVKSDTPHPFVVGAVKTDSAVDYTMMVNARGAAAAFQAAAAAAKLAVAGSKFRSARVMQHLHDARWHIDAAGDWPYDDALRPAAMQPAATAAVDLAIACGLVQQGEAGDDRTAPAAANALYGATALVAALSAPATGNAAALHRWATGAAAALRLEAAAELRDPRPPARAMAADAAQVLLEQNTVSAAASARVIARLRLGVALNGYISPNETPATIATIVALPAAAALTTHILEPAVKGLKARWAGEVAALDNLGPYEQHLGIRA